MINIQLDKMRLMIVVKMRLITPNSAKDKEQMIRNFMIDLSV